MHWFATGTMFVPVFPIVIWDDYQITRLATVIIRQVRFNFAFLVDLWIEPVFDNFQTQFAIEETL